MGTWPAALPIPGAGRSRSFSIGKFPRTGVPFPNERARPWLRAHNHPTGPMGPHRVKNVTKKRNPAAEFGRTGLPCSYSMTMLSSTPCMSAERPASVPEETTSTVARLSLLSNM